MRIVFLLGGLLLPSALIAAERIVERSIEVDPDVHFTLESHRGTVEIMTTDADTVEIAVVIEHEDSDVLDDVHIDIDSSDSRVRVRSEYRGERASTGFLNIFGMNNWFANVDYPAIHYRITIPEQALLSLDAHRSELTVEAPSGQVNINAHRSSGYISGVRGDLSLDTHRGDFDIDVIELHDIELQAHRGDIKLEIAGSDNFTLRGKTHRGKVNVVGRDIQLDREERGAEVRHIEGNGQNLIDFDSHRGNVRISFLD